VQRVNNGLRVVGGNVTSEVENLELRQADLANDPSTLALIGVSEDLAVADLSPLRNELQVQDNYQDPASLDQVAETERREEDASYARTMTINLQNADIKTILRSISDFSGRNVIASPEVEGQVTVSLRDVPWREALSVILRAHDFGFVEENGIIRVDTAESLREAKLLEKSADRRSDELEALVTRIVPIDFANAEEIKGAVSEVLTNRGAVQVDARTNSLIVNDIPASVDAVAELARELDTRTPQVHIDALLIDLDTRSSSELGVDWGAFNVDTGTNLFGDASVTAPITEVAGQVRIGTITDFGELRGTIQALARDNIAEIISNPKITTTDNREANILVGKKIPLITQDMAGNSVTRLETIGIRLIVTPHINSDSQITLDVHPEVSDLSSQATVQGGVIINTSEADTRVLVGNRETAVIGGLIRSLSTTFTSGVPVLKDIPLFGALFRSESTNDEQRELIVFLTPTIIEAEGVGTERAFQLKENIQDKINGKLKSSK
jgi:type IV pilus assembly protein PilQ